MNRLRIRILPAVLWFGICTWLFTLPGKDLPQESWLDMIWIDKWVHIFLFGMLTFLWCRVPAHKTAKIFLGIAAACLLYGVAVEFIQKYWVPGRSFDTGDMLADAGGCLAGVIFSIRLLIKK